MNTSKRFNIVLLDDDPASNFINTTLLKMANVVDELNVFTQSTVALEHLYHQLTNQETRSAKSALLFIDINMPGMNGFEVIEALQSSHPNFHNQITVCFLSSSVHQRDKNRAEELGADQYLEKPLTAAKIRSLFSTLQGIAS